MFYAGKKILVTGGLGFIGSSLALRLAQEGAEVTVADPVVDGCGGNHYNLEPVKDRVRILSIDIAEAHDMTEEIRQAEVIFNLAGEISHIHSVDFPERDLQINTISQLRFLLTVRQEAPGKRVVFAGTRQVYGVPEYLPLDEEHPVRPVDFNGVHKGAATFYHLMLARTGDLDCVVLSPTNVYGPRMALDIPCQGVLSTFFRRALRGETLEVFGDGKQLRDPVYVDDAVEAFLLAGRVRNPQSRTLNIGGSETLELLRIAEVISAACGGNPPVLREFPPERKAIDIGSYYADYSRIRSELGWKPRVTFEEGVRRTVDYYRQHMDAYLDPNQPVPTCNLPEHTGVRRRLSFSPI